MRYSDRAININFDNDSILCGQYSSRFNESAKKWESKNNNNNEMKKKHEMTQTETASD